MQNDPKTILRMLGLAVLAFFLFIHGGYVPAALVVGAMCVIAYRNRPAPPTGNYGTARWADRQDLKDMLGDEGIILGRIDT